MEWEMEKKERMPRRTWEKDTLKGQSYKILDSVFRRVCKISTSYRSAFGFLSF